MNIASSTTGSISHRRGSGPSRREAGLVTKRIQGARGYAQLRKQDVDRRFPGLLDSILNADAATRLTPSRHPAAPHPAVILARTVLAFLSPNLRAQPAERAHQGRCVGGAARVRALWR